MDEINTKLNKLSIKNNTTKNKNKNIKNRCAGGGGKNT
jgi:hypothetical protein